MISRIKNVWIRRTVLVLSYPVVMLLGVFCGAWLGIREVLADIHGAAVNAWFAK